MDCKQMIGFITGKPGRHPYPEHMQQARRIASEGMVLLKNDNQVLPLQAEKVALFGAGAVDTVVCGTGSGYVFAPYTVNVEQGLRDAGMTLTSGGWLRRFADRSRRANKEDKTLTKLDRLWSGLSILIDEIEIMDADLEEAREADTAIYVIRRNSGEGKDRKAEKGDYYLSDIEERNLRRLAAAFPKVAVVLNTCVVDANFLWEIPGIDAALLMGQAGNESGNALADVLTGKVNPSGHLTDTWARKYSDNPASAVFGANDGNSLQEDYVEDIFVGYRYFDTFHIQPLFPFGYGLSYTTFRKTCKEVRVDWKQITMTVEITNTGRLSGRDVVQVYVTAPEGRLTKPYQELKGYRKTKELKSGETQTVTITIPTESLSSFDTGKSAFIMEPGDYLLRMGSSSRDTETVGVIRLDREAAVRQVRNEFRPDRELKTWEAPARKQEAVSAPIKEGVAQVSVNGDGSKRVTYRGTDRGAYLERGDVQACVCRVLEQIMNSVSYREMIKA